MKMLVYRPHFFFVNFVNFVVKKRILNCSVKIVRNNETHETHENFNFISVNPEMKDTEFELHHENSIYQLFFPHTGLLNSLSKLTGSHSIHFLKRI